MKRLLAVIAVSVLSAVSFSNSADATCTVNSALPVRVHLNTTTAKIYFRPHVVGGAILAPNPALSSYYWYSTVSTTTTSGAAIAAAATDAVTNQTRIALTGDAATCPSTIANESIGNVIGLIVNP